MKHLIHFTNVRFRARGQIIIALLLFSTIAIAQEQTPPKEFVLDASMSYDALFIPPIYNSYIECGFNTMTQRATDSSKSLLNNFNLHAINAQDSLQWIYYYSSSYYSKWEAEQNQTDTLRVGIKHAGGDTATWKNSLCWSTKDVIEPTNKLIFGPTYHQEKWYRRWYSNYTSDEDRYNLKYTPRFRMALANPYSVPDTQNVCRIYVILKYCFVGEDGSCSTSTHTLKEPVTLKVSDFPSNGEFDYIYFSNYVEERSYDYPSWTRDPAEYKLILPHIEGTYFDDRRGGQGVQFCIDWLRTDTLCTLYIDNIEVYDNNGWDQYVDHPIQTAAKIKAYADSFKTLGWTNIKHWLGTDEPYTIDAYTPIRVVDSLIRLVNPDAPLMVAFNPTWSSTYKINGEDEVLQFHNRANLDKYGFNLIYKDLIRQKYLKLENLK
jgi:hypothetical protein